MDIESLELENKRLKYVIDILLKEQEYFPKCHQSEHWDECENCPLDCGSCYTQYLCANEIEDTLQNHKRFLWDLAKNAVKENKD